MVSAAVALGTGAGVPCAVQAAGTWQLDALPTGAVSEASGNLDTLVADLADLMPQRGSGTYREPSASMALRLRRGVIEADRGRLTSAARTLAPLHFRVVRYRDTATNRALIVLGQARSDWLRGRAWGLFVLDRTGGARLIEAPHPRSDLHSERMAVAVFRRSRARGLLVAGAHRFTVPLAAGERWAQADVAHRRGSAFHAAHRALRSRGLATVVQLHGFEVAPGGSPPEAIVSSATSVAAAPARRVHRRLVDGGIRSCLFRSDACPKLGATQNVQGQETNAAGDAFVHVELALRLREAASRARVARAIAAGLVS